MPLRSAALSRSLRTAGYRLELVRTVGVRHAARRLRFNLRHRRRLSARRSAIPDLIWRQAAAELGATVTELAPQLLEFRLGAASARIRGQTTPLADPVSAELADNKPLAYEILTRAGLPVPEHALVAVNDLSSALAFMASGVTPCIVKPAQGAGGSGISGEVRHPAQMRLALRSAGRFHDQVLLERQAVGDSYRLLVLDGTVLDIIRRPRPRVLGDGRSTIEDLIFGQYAERIDDPGPGGLKPLVIDFDCLFTVAQAGYEISSVPAAGEPVPIKTVTNYNGSRESEALTRPYPERLVALAVRAAAALGVRLGGVDLVAERSDDAVVLEVNAIPGLTHHYNVTREGEHGSIATDVLATLLGVQRPPAASQ